MMSERTAHDGWESSALHTLFQWLQCTAGIVAAFAASESWQCTAASCTFHEGTEVGQGNQEAAPGAFNLQATLVQCSNLAHGASLLQKSNVAVDRSPLTQSVVGSSLPPETSMMVRMMTAVARKRGLICLAVKVRIHPSMLVCMQDMPDMPAKCLVPGWHHPQQLSEKLHTVSDYTLLEITRCTQPIRK